MSIFQTQWHESVISASFSLSLRLSGELKRCSWRCRTCQQSSPILSACPVARRYSWESFLCRPDTSVQLSFSKQRELIWANPWAAFFFFFYLSLFLSPPEWKYLFLARVCEFLLRCPHVFQHTSSSIVRAWQQSNNRAGKYWNTLASWYEPSHLERERSGCGTR